MARLSLLKLLCLLTLLCVSTAIAGEKPGICARAYGAVTRLHPFWKAEKLREVSARSFRIFQNADSATPEDLAHLRSEGLEEVFEKFKKHGSKLRDLNLWLAGHKRFQPDPTLKGWRRLQHTWKLFIPQVASRARFRADRIFGKALNNPSYVLSPSEEKFLRKWNLKEHLERFRADLPGQTALYQKYERIRTAGAWAKWLSVTGITGAGIAALPEKKISLEQSFDPQSPDGMSTVDRKVELIFEFPVPNASIRIGGLVYNFGVMSITRQNLRQFRELTAGGALEDTQSHVRVELKLTPEERSRLLMELDESLNKPYVRVFPFNDGTSQLNGALKKTLGFRVPPVIDRSPAATLNYLRLQRMLGNSRVGAIVSAKKNSSHGIDGMGADAAAMASGTIDSAYFLTNAGKLLLVSPVLDQLTP